jgi:hypothetical protein
MSTLEQVMENLESADDSEPGVLTKEELDVINQIAQKYKESGYIGCTGCKYCMPCPQGVNIPEIIALYNEFYVRGRDNEVKKKYRENITPETNAKKCVKCGTCETLCPQQLPIRNILRGATFTFEQNA